MKRRGVSFGLIPPSWKLVKCFSGEILQSTTTDGSDRLFTVPTQTESRMFARVCGSVYTRLKVGGWRPEKKKGKKKGRIASHKIPSSAGVSLKH